MKRSLVLILLLTFICITLYAETTNKLFIDSVNKSDIKEAHNLLKKGADINNLDTGVSALMIATKDGNYEMVEFLLSQKADPDLVGKAIKWTPLLVAVFNNEVEILQLLLENGADVNQIDDKEGATVLHVALNENPTLQIIKILLNYNANSNIVLKSQKLTPLILTAKSRLKDSEAVEVVKILLSRNADINAQDKRGATALHYAAVTDKAKLIQLLLDAGADKDIRTEDGQTALNLANKFSKDPFILKLLSQKESTINLLVLEETNLRYTTLDGGLPLKSNPSMMSQTIDIIPAGDIVQIISIKKQVKTIDGLQGYWSEVDWDSTIGWVFDPFLSFDPVEPEENGLYLLNKLPSVWTVLTLINDELVILSSRYVEAAYIQIDKTEPLYPDLSFNLGQETEMYTIKAVIRYGLDSYGFTIYNRSTGQKYKAHFKLLNQHFSAEWTNLRGQGLKIITVNSEHTEEYDQYEEEYDEEY